VSSLVNVERQQRGAIWREGEHLIIYCEKRESWEKDPIESEEFSYKFVIPFYPTYVVEIVPRYNVIQFFTDVSNSLSAWTGLYIMSLKDELFEWLMRKCKGQID
jgi:hypothetical protein